MPAFLSSDQLRDLTGDKAIIELDVAGFGLLTVNENIYCDHCKKPGHVTMPKGVTGCMHCQRVKADALTDDEIETFQSILGHVPEMLQQAKKYYHERFATTRKRKNTR